MIVSINQPAYLPWLGYFDRIKRSDFHIVLDHVQLEKGGFTNRTRIRQPDGRVMWLTIPVEKGKPINKTRIVDKRWRAKHRKTLEQTYGKIAPAFLSEITGDRLIDVLLMATLQLSFFLNMWNPYKHPELYSSHLKVKGAKSDLVLNLCREVGATQYLSGANGRNYLDIPAFDKAGIEVIYHDFPHDPPVLSALDYLFGSSIWPQPDLISAHSSLALAQETQAKE